MNYIKITDELVDYLLKLIGGRKVLEVFSGSGELAKALQAKGVSITATGVTTSGYDGTDKQPEGVLKLDAVAATKTLADSHDILLASWPIADDSMLHCALYFNKPIIFIGELYHKHPLNISKTYSGTASDNYYECVYDAIEPNTRILKNSAICLHQLKNGGHYPCTPQLNFYKWSNREDLTSALSKAGFVYKPDKQA